jgi:DNA-binding XRE family transcriptional regulator
VTVQELRIMHRLEQDELAEKLGLSIHRLSKLERGKEAPNDAEKHAIAKLFGIRPQDITAQDQASYQVRRVFKSTKRAPQVNGQLQPITKEFPTEELKPTIVATAQEAGLALAPQTDLGTDHGRKLDPTDKPKTFQGEERKFLDRLVAELGLSESIRRLLHPSKESSLR